MDGAAGTLQWSGDYRCQFGLVNARKTAQVGNYNQQRLKKHMTDLRPDQTAQDNHGSFSLISEDTFRSLYANLLKCRTLRNGSRSRNSGGAFDGAEVALAMDLSPQDLIISVGCDRPIQSLVHSAGSRKSVAKSRSTDRHTFPEILESALGAALLQKSTKNGRVTVIFSDSAASEAWQNAFEAARSHRLPILFVLESDTPGDRLPVNSTIAPGEEMPHITVDGNDVVAAYRVAHESIERARRGRGSTLIECANFKLKGARGNAHADAVVNMERYLRGKGLLTK